MKEQLPIIWQTENAGVPALYNGGLPAEFETKKVKKPWFNKKIQTVGKIKDFLKVEENKMVVYRIIPHANVTNNNKRLWRAIYKMFEMYESPTSRIERDGFKFTFREKDYFWFDIVFKQVKGEKKIEFYVATSEYQAVKLKRKLENKMAVTIQEAAIDDLKIPNENTIIQEMKYLNHDIFSMDTNTQNTKTPIAGILNTIDELQFDGDFARLSICNEAENRHKWVKSAQWAHEKLRKGKVPQRAGAGGKVAVTGAKKAIVGVINEINDLLTDTFQAMSNAFFKSDKEFKKEKVITKAHGLEDEINSKRLSGASLEKVNQPVFKSRVRVAAHSQDRLTRETIGETLGLSFADISENNELQGVKIKMRGRQKEVIEELNTMKLSQKTKLSPDVNLISTEEMAKLALQMPNQELQRRYSDELSVKKRVEVDVPSVFTKDNGIDLGVANVKDQEYNISIPLDNPDEFYRGYAFVGGMGMGKDSTIKNFVVEGIEKKNISFIIPDVICEEGNRGLANGIRDALPPEKVIDIDLGNEDYIAPMDLTEVIAKLGRKGASRFGDEMIGFMDLEGLSRSQKYLREAAKASGGSLHNIKRIIEDEEFRLDAITRLQEEGNVRLAQDLINWGTNDDLGNKADAILNRLDQFFGNDTLYDVFSQPPKKELDFEKWMKEGKAIILRIPNRKLGELATKTLTHWITLKVFMTRMLMEKQDQEVGAMIVFNEPEQFMTPGLSKLMGRIATEGRKERLGSIFAFHHWGKLPNDLQDNLIAGGINLFLFANDSRKTWELSESRLNPTLTIDDALVLPKYHAIFSIRAGGELQNAFTVKMNEPVKERYDNSFLTKRHAQMFGRSWQELQKAL